MVEPSLSELAACLPTVKTGDLGVFFIPSKRCMRFVLETQQAA